MPNGFPSFRNDSLFPGEKPPTLFHPASPKSKTVKPAKASKEVDNASMMSTSTFSSTVSLLKDKLHSSNKKSSPYVSEKQSSMKYADIVNGEHKTPRQRTAEAYMITAMTRT